MNISPETIWEDIRAIREQAPLVHNITNFVVMNTTANALLALGASPVMAHARAEVEEMAAISSALVINIGTLSDPWISSMNLAAQKANSCNIPIIIDPVGAGATHYRTMTATTFIEAFAPEIIRGNGSEIMALCQDGVATKGVDSTSESGLALDSAKSLNRSTNSVVCITGETDYVVDKTGFIAIKNGHPMMPRVTGLGCTASALCGAFAAVNSRYAMAVAHAMAVMGIAGEIAAETAKGPASLQAGFIDALYCLTRDDIERYFRE
jgi:hydroxyethylthiazole kinase